MLSALLCLTLNSRPVFQTPGLDPYCYKVSFFIDNLPSEITSDVIDSVYYFKLNRLSYKTSVINDSVNRITECHLRSTKAKDGFLFVNECVSNTMRGIESEDDKTGVFSLKSKENPIVNSHYKITYVCNNKVIRTKREVLQLLRLRKKRIEVSQITRDDHLGIITVYITTKVKCF